MAKKSLHIRAAGGKSVAKTPKRSIRTKAREGAIAKKRLARSRKKALGIARRLRSPEKTIAKKRSPTASGTKAPESRARSSKPPIKLFIDVDELPLRYDSTRLALIARDPHWIYAYWEISPRSQNAVKRKFGPAIKKASYVLRLHDITNLGSKGTVKSRYLDVPIEPSAQSRYIQLAGDNATYCAELFVRSRSGKYVLLARSNSVSTPNAGACESTEQTWMHVKQGEGVAPQIMQTIPENPLAAGPDLLVEPTLDISCAAARSTDMPGPISKQADNEPAKPETSLASEVEPTPYEPIPMSIPGTVSEEKAHGAPEAPQLGSSELLPNRGDFPSPGFS